MEQLIGVSFFSFGYRRCSAMRVLCMLEGNAGNRTHARNKCGGKGLREGWKKGLLALLSTLCVVWFGTRGSSGNSGLRMTVTPRSPQSPSPSPRRSYWTHNLESGASGFNRVYSTPAYSSLAAIYATMYPQGRTHELTSPQKRPSSPLLSPQIVTKSIPAHAIAYTV